MNNKFKKDLAKWQEYEKKIMNVLNKNGFNIIKNWNEKDIDLLLIKWWIECKVDEKAKFTNNFYIEFESNWEPSGVYKKDNYHLVYWAHSDGEYVYIIQWNKIQRWVSDMVDKCRNNKSNTYRWFRVVENWWDGGRTKGLLVPIHKLKKQANYIYKLT